MQAAMALTGTRLNLDINISAPFPVNSTNLRFEAQYYDPASPTKRSPIGDSKL